MLNFDPQSNWKNDSYPPMKISLFYIIHHFIRMMANTALSDLICSIFSKTYWFCTTMVYSKYWHSKHGEELLIIKQKSAQIIKFYKWLYLIKTVFLSIRKGSFMGQNLLLQKITFLKDEDIKEHSCLSNCQQLQLPHNLPFLHESSSLRDSISPHKTESIHLRRKGLGNPQQIGTVKYHPCHYRPDRHTPLYWI